MPRLEPLTFEAFQAMLGDWLNLEAAQLRPEAYFISDLGVDSLRILTVLLRLQEMGLELDFGQAYRVQTVADAYRYYLAQAQSGD